MLQKRQEDGRFLGRRLAEFKRLRPPVSSLRPRDAGSTPRAEVRVRSARPITGLRSREIRALDTATAAANGAPGTYAITGRGLARCSRRVLRADRKRGSTARVKTVFVCGESHRGDQRPRTTWSCRNRGGYRRDIFPSLRNRSSFSLTVYLSSSYYRSVAKEQKSEGV